MEKIDFRKKLRPYYSPKASEVELIEIPPFQFAMVDGRGDPNDSVEFQQAVEALYSFSYTLKFGRKKAGLGPDYTIGALEGLWWHEQGLRDFEALMSAKGGWLWTLMIMQPDFIGADELQATVEELQAKKPNPKLGELRLETLEEGLVVQVMHVGPYAEEGPTLEKLQRYIEAHGLEFRDKHHEIYLGDPRRAKPEKLKTILRHPVRSVSS